ncbi:hypothetical protein F5Y16DRAFT_419562 [Xylariaceae sp. FL0255]|nr:hypothetical protein F5Y16DRAFT_419562 [Xylariaceae sp. FL0255]
MDFKYIDQHGPIGPHEQEVYRNGYNWVRTNTLPSRLDTEIDFNNPDRLLRHSHHGKNTHLIVTGDLKIENRTKRVNLTISTAVGHQREAEVGPNEFYKGSTVAGCSFVEGHQCLSPRTAERFIDRGTLVAVPRRRWDGAAACVLPNPDTLREWLRKAIFRPGGRAVPCPVLNERSVLDFAPEHEPKNDDEAKTQLAIKYWFENEWRQSPAVFLRWQRWLRLVQGFCSQISSSRWFKHGLIMSMFIAIALTCGIFLSLIIGLPLYTIRTLRYTIAKVVIVLAICYNIYLYLNGRLTWLPVAVAFVNGFRKESEVETLLRKVHEGKGQKSWY